MTFPKARGYLVHLYTMSTLAFVVLGIQWTLEGRYAAALIAMAVTLVIDATDGALARKYRIAHTAPGIDGALLDNVVDFTSYVFLPLLFMMHAGMLAQPMTLFAAVVAFSSAFGFSRTSAKQVDEGFFVGFPSYWNVVALYAFLLDLPAGVTTALVLALSLLVFVDVRFLYVSRLRRHRLLHLVLGGAWGAACLLALLLEPGALRTVLIYGSLGYVAFYTAHSLVADLDARRRAPDPGQPRGA
jgi:phosphatidylcholine synthase